MKKILNPPAICICFILSFCFVKVTAQTLTVITTQPVTLPGSCSPISVNVNFTTNGNANSGNVFTAQLSDGFGSFSNPVTIGTLTATTAGTISCNISAATGQGYRIRVKSSNPVVTGSNNGTNLNITSPLTALLINGPITACGGLNYSYTYTAGGSPGTPVWSISGSSGIISNPPSPISVSYYNVLSPSISTLSAYASDNGCSGPVTNYQVAVYPSQQAAFTVSGSTTFCQGDSVVLTSTNTQDGSCLQFDGVNDYINILGQPNTGKRFTAEAWIFSSAGSDGAYRGIIGNTTQTNALRPPSLYVYNGTSLHGGFGDGVNWNSFTVSNVIQSGTWNHVAMTFDSTTLLVYVNGYRIYSSNIYAGSLPYPTPVTRVGGLTNFFKGKIDEVRIWNVARSSSEIKNGMQYVAPNSTGLVAFYKLDDGLGNTISNSSGNQIAATRPTNSAQPLWNSNPATKGFLWSTGERTPSITVKKSGTYSLFFTNTYGCADSSALPGTTVTVKPVPVVTALAGVTCAGTPVSLTGTPPGGTFNLPNPYNGPDTTFTYTYTGTNGCANQAQGYINHIPIPNQTGPIQTTGGAAKVCPGQIKTYYVDSSFATSYLWVVPTGASINSGQGTYKLTVLFGTGFIAADTLFVTVNNSCGQPATNSLIIERNNPAQPSTITGSDYGICQLNAVPYSVTNVAGMTYNWSFSSTNATVVTGQGTKAITANYGSGFISGNLLVTAQNACGISQPRNKSIYGKPKQASTLTGPTSVCANQTGVGYNISPISNISNYTWSAPAGSTISDGITTGGSTFTTLSPVVSVNFGVAGGTVKVRGNNSCGSGTYKTKSVTIVCKEAAAADKPGNLHMFAYPNPAHEEINLFFNSNNKLHFEIILRDVLGKSLITRKGVSETGKNEIKFPIFKLAPGIYFLEILSGNESEVLKVAIE